MSVTDNTPDSLAADGGVLVQGILSVTDNGPDSAAIDGEVLVQGDLAVTDSGPDTLVADGCVGFNLWQIITNNSTFPIDPANCLWDHLNNQQGEGGTTTVTVMCDSLPKFSDAPEQIIKVVDTRPTVTVVQEDEQVSVTSVEEKVSFKVQIEEFDVEEC